MTDDMMGDTWDLGEVLAERAQPTTEISVYLNEMASYTKAQLVKAHADAKADEVDKIDDAIKDINEQLEKTKYTLHLTAVPSRMREDIASKALAKYPIKPTGLFNQDDVENARLRRQYEDNLIWHAQITDVVNPSGQHKRAWTFEEMEKFSQALPTPVQNAVDAAIRELTNQAEEFTVASKSLDF